ncbi:MAG: hypothetical protein PHR77_01640 [Kiritimatiellae bacterium]|nr:hypothetical protein [Kiritimatiellia bacterium]MDD5521909.1 hypothetical protein [Kiritimatiellia bacterium]
MITGVIIVLAWPIGSWLEYREKQVRGIKEPDAIYLVAGSIDQDRRIDALVDFYSKSETNAKVVILIGNDRLKSRWSQEEQANLTRAEWGFKNVKKRLSSPVIQIEIVPGRFGGTDGEMEALGKYLENHHNIKRLVIVTSPFHVRRALRRLFVYFPHEKDVSVVTARGKWSDRAPWIVLGELFKIGRDSLGLSRMPFLSRKCRD